MATLFTRIIQGELPSYKVFENDRVYAFLALDQINPGHTLVVPKTEVDHLMDVPEADLSAVFLACKPLARAIKSAFGCKRVGIMVQGFEVPHFHVHLVPVNSPGELDFSRARRHQPDEMLQFHERLVNSLNTK
jgi:histidine triad (HIT) family protein